MSKTSSEARRWPSFQRGLPWAAGTWFAVNSVVALLEVLGHVVVTQNGMAGLYGLWYFEGTRRAYLSDFIPAEAQFSHYMGGEYYEIERPHRLVMSGRAVNDEQGELFATLIEVTFEARDGGTALTIRQSYFEPMPPAEAMAGAEQGWSEQLDKLERLLAD